MKNKNDTSPVKKIFILVVGLLVIFNLSKLVVNYVVVTNEFFPAQRMIKILVGVVFVIMSYLIYRRYY